MIGDELIVRGLSGFRRFVRAAREALIGAVSMLRPDVMPRGLVPAPRGGGGFVDRARRMQEVAESAPMREVTDFIMARPDRSFLRH